MLATFPCNADRIAATSSGSWHVKRLRATGRDTGRDALWRGPGGGSSSLPGGRQGSRRRANGPIFWTLLVQKRLLLPDQADALRVTVECQVPAANQIHLPGPEDRNQRVLGNYRLLRLLGIGGMSAVYLGYDAATQQKVAIKILSDELAGQQASLDRFSREARSGLLLDHPNIVRNLTGGQDRATGVHYLVLEYVDGPSAHALLDSSAKLSSGRTPYASFSTWPAA